MSELIPIEDFFDDISLSQNWQNALVFREMC